MSAANSVRIDPVELLRELIRVPSVNRMGRPVDGPIYGETRLTNHLAQWLERHKLPFERVEASPGRENIVARLDSPGATRTVLLDVHQDTVPVDGMTIDPFAATMENGRIFGRGACDVKGGMACMLAALVTLRDEGGPRLPNVLLSLTVDEESTSTGIRHLAEAWERGSGTSAYRLLGAKPDVALVAEPTQLHAVVAHRGVLRFKVRTSGIACHSSRPQDGVSAIYRMAKVVSCLERYAAELPTSKPPHPLLGPPSLSVGVISGGMSSNIVPDACEIEVDRRLIPGESRDEVLGDLHDYLSRHGGAPFTFDPPYGGCDPLNDDLARDWSTRLLDAIRPIAGPRERLGVPYGTHASRLAAAGIPSIVFGPGDIAQAHTKDEWIAVDQLAPAVACYVAFCRAAGSLEA